MACVVLEGRARACSPPPPTARAVPAAGEVDVSTRASIVIISRHQPTTITIRAGEQLVANEGLEKLGPGSDGVHPQALVTFWRVLGVPELPASSEIVVTGIVGAGASMELTRFHTGAGANEDEGTPPRIDAVRLWRVQYPQSEISSGNCVSKEWHSWVALEYEAGSIPDVPPESRIHLLSLRPRDGSPASTYLTTGPSWYRGNTPLSWGGPRPGAWDPTLDPTKEYCLTVEVYGRDVTAAPLASNDVCAAVSNQPIGLDAGPGPGSDAGAGVNMGEGGGGGCAVAGGSGQPGWLVVLVLALLIAARRSGRSSGRIACFPRRPCTPPGAPRA